MIHLILETAFLTILIVCLAFIGLQRGMITALRERISGTKGTDGKNRTNHPSRPADNCFVLHQTAATETELYGAIVSKSVFDHMQECPLKPEAIAHAPHTVTNNCAHEWEVYERTSALSAVMACAWCGNTKTVQYHNGVPRDVPACAHDWVESEHTVAGKVYYTCRGCHATKTKEKNITMVTETRSDLKLHYNEGGPIKNG